MQVAVGQRQLSALTSTVDVNCTNFSWTIYNMKSKDIRLALIKVNLIFHDLGYLQDKFDFSDEDMQSVPQAPFEYLRETFKDTAFLTPKWTP